MLVELAGNTEDPVAAIASEAGLYVSRLSEAYAGYDEDLFMETLNDWGWFSEERLAPDWYTGNPWS